MVILPTTSCQLNLNRLCTDRVYIDIVQYTCTYIYIYVCNFVARILQTSKQAHCVDTLPERFHVLEEDLYCILQLPCQRALPGFGFAALLTKSIPACPRRTRRQINIWTHCYVNCWIPGVLLVVHPKNLCAPFLLVVSQEVSISKPYVIVVFTDCDVTREIIYLLLDRRN